MIDSRVRMSIVGVIVAGACSARSSPGSGTCRSRRRATTRPRRSSNSVRIVQRAADPRPDPRRQGSPARRQPDRERHHDRPQALAPRTHDGRERRLAELLQVPPATIRKKLDDPAVSPYRRCRSRSTSRSTTSRTSSEHREDFPGSTPSRSRSARTRTAHLPRTCSATSARSTTPSSSADAKRRTTSSATTIGKAGVEHTLRVGPARQAAGRPDRGRQPRPALRTVDRATGRSPATTSSSPSTSTCRSVPRRRSTRRIVAARATQGHELKKGSSKLAAPAGSVVVLDAQDGSVVAMASNPTYDPNEFVERHPHADRGRRSTTPNHFPLIDRAIRASTHRVRRSSSSPRSPGSRPASSAATDDDQRQGFVS